MEKLPSDLRAYLDSNQNFDFMNEGSEVGPISFVSGMDLKLKNFQLTLGPQGEIDDPYGSVFKGFYSCEAYDLVAKSEQYDPKGLLCWIPRLERFGCINEEHGSFQSFPMAAWTDIVKCPAYYLDMQWSGNTENGEFEEHLPWLILPLHSSKPRVKVIPYELGSTCLVHQKTVLEIDGDLEPLLIKLRSHAYKSWWPSFKNVFPCPGLPNSQSTLFACSDCREAELDWFKGVIDSMKSMEANQIEKNLFQCPNCEFRFRKNEFKKRNPFCQMCGQKLTI